MKTTALSLAVVLALSSSAFAILRPRFPHRPVPPYNSQVIIIVDESIQTPPGHPAVTPRK
jgi:hypothetical protein